MKKRTLNQTWTLCLRMWRSISKAKMANPRLWVSALKRRWLHDNGFKNLKGDCFFCEFKKEKRGCFGCPGKLVDTDTGFNCCTGSYHYRYKPVAFYKELLRLNRIRKAKK